MVKSDTNKKEKKVKILKEGKIESISIYDFREIMGKSMGREGLGEHMSKSDKKVLEPNQDKGRN